MKGRKLTQAKAPRSGVTLLEMTVAAGMLAVVLAGTVKMLHALGTSARAAERRAVAQRMLDNLAEQVAATPWDAVETESLAKTLHIPQPASTVLPNPALDLRVVKVSEPVVAKRITICVSWSGTEGRKAAPMSLTTWVFPSAGET